MVLESICYGAASSYPCAQPPESFLRKSLVTLFNTKSFTFISMTYVTSYATISTTSTSIPSPSPPPMVHHAYHRHNHHLTTTTTHMTRWSHHEKSVVVDQTVAFVGRTHIWITSMVFAYTCEHCANRGVCLYCMYWMSWVLYYMRPITQTGGIDMTCMHCDDHRHSLI